MFSAMQKKAGEMVRRYKIADVVFDAEFIYAYTAHVCQNYLYTNDGAPEFFIKMTDADVLEESERSPGFEKPYLESLAFYRKLLGFLLDRNAIIFHSSALAVDGKAYLFTAPSGTGKSTHARLWRELLGDKVVMINDDKPIVRLVDGKFFVYGTPWNGKHELDTNCRAQVQAICKLERGEQNSICKISPNEMLPTLLSQTLRANNQSDVDKLLPLAVALLNGVSLYKLKCNMHVSAAELSYKTMSEGNHEN